MSEQKEFPVRNTCVAIEFKAGDNQDVVLTVKTDAKSWAFEKNGEWIVAKQDGDKLTVNAQANTTESRTSGPHHDYGR